jgi:hypothetical protein
MRFGDTCRAKNGAPARFIGYGFCMYVSAQSNCVHIAEAVPSTGGEERLPLPMDKTLRQGRTYAFKGWITSTKPTKCFGVEMNDD